LRLGSNLGVRKLQASEPEAGKRDCAKTPAERPGLENGARESNLDRVKLFDQYQGQVSAEGCSHHRTGRSIERLLIKTTVQD
jgi:hypothetical protein